MRYTKLIVFFMLSYYIIFCFDAIFPVGLTEKAAGILLLTVGLYGLDSLFGFVKTEKREETSGRFSGCDILRTFAVLFVPLVHFFGLSNFYGENLSYALFIPLCIRWLSVTAVPLFMIITGFLKCNKTVGLKHYSAILPVLATHIFVSSIRILSDKYCRGIEITNEYIADKLLFFDYGWYVQLYIGMLLIMPFVNSAYHGLTDKRHKEMLVLTLVFLTDAGPLTKLVVPSTWLILYVFAYYCFGMYVREYRIKINPVFTVAMLVFITALTAAATTEHANGGVLDWDFIGYSANSGYSCFPVFVIATLMTILLMDIKLPSALAFPFRSLGKISLEMYLFSQMFDVILYPSLAAEGWAFADFWHNCIFVLSVIYTGALLFSSVKFIIFGIVKMPFGCLKMFIENRRK